MTTHEIADEMKVGYQIVLRVMRALKKASPDFLDGVGRKGHGRRKGFDFEGAKLEAILNGIKGRPTKGAARIKPSTKEQRDAWFSTWYDRFLNTQEHENWERLGAMVGLIVLSRDAEFLQSSVGELRVGDRILSLIEAIDPSMQIFQTDPFSVWLQDSGFILEGYSLPA